MSNVERPKFKTVKTTTTYENPEALFYRLSEREKTHGYLRGPQQDVLREYAKDFVQIPDVAFELPTGTGKTAVGLLIAEWWRTKGFKVAFLSLTNQLAGQVLEEAVRLRLSAADLRGDKNTRSKSEEGRYRTGEAVALTTYSNLFNIRPVINDVDVIVMDDAHGAEQYVSDMWSVTVSAQKKELFGTVLSALKPAFTNAQIRSILSRSSMGSVEIPDLLGHPECLPKLVAALDESDLDTVKFAWGRIRNHLESCIILVSGHGVTIRPLIAPTHTHEAFESARQRIYMSATLGGGSDLQRSYGKEKVGVIRAQSPQWGRRYIFVPGLHVSSEQADQIAAAVWNGLEKRRALLLGPSAREVEARLKRLVPNMKPAPKVIGAQDIADRLDGFTGATDVLLALASRYDGLDLPDDQCRLLILSESPAAVNSLERHLRERWKMGPVLRARARTRLTQGLGRCTRSATDFSIVIWLGQSLVDFATSRPLIEDLPAEIRAEISWGVAQSKGATNSSELVEMMLGLVHDGEYRQQADDDLKGIPPEKKTPPTSSYDTAGPDEVRFAKALWDDNFSYAQQVAHKIADQLNATDLAGYRAWWWYLASRAASLMGDKAAEQDCLRRGASCGVNSGWLNAILHKRNAAADYASEQQIEPNAEGLWDNLSDWGWAGPGFEKAITAMLQNLQNQYHVRFHEGLRHSASAMGRQSFVEAIRVLLTASGHSRTMFILPSKQKRKKERLASSRRRTFWRPRAMSIGRKRSWPSTATAQRSR